MKRMLKYLFGWSSRYCCSFCGKHHSEVANLIEGPDCYICNHCVKICSDVLIKECAEYREDFREACRKTEPSAAPNAGPATLRGNSGQAGGGTEKATTQPTIGQQLIDLQKARDAGAITEVEYQTQKTDLLGRK